MSNVELEKIFQWATESDISTPAYLFCEGNVRSALAYLRAHLGARVSYATKANVHPLMLAALANDVDEFNVTNTTHMRAVLAAGVPPEQILFINPVIQTEAAGAALAAGIRRFVVDDDRGLHILTSLCEGLRLTLRLRSSRSSASARSIARFGNTVEGVRELGRRARNAGAYIEALSFFVGTHTGSDDPLAPYRSALKEAGAVHHGLAAQGIELPAINIGGGFAGARRKFYCKHPNFFEQLADEISVSLPEDVTVICEPGRFLSEPAMAMFARVVADRTINNQRMTYLDASAYAGLFESTFIDHSGDGLAIVTNREGVATDTYLLGPIMDSFDVIKCNALLPPLDEGDIILLPNIGAYSWGYAASCEGLCSPDVLRLPPELDELMAAARFD